MDLSKVFIINVLEKAVVYTHLIIYFHTLYLVIPYEITVFTGDVKDAGVDNDVTMTIFGSDGATPDVKLEKGDEKFERGGVDMFRMELEDVGKLRKMRIGQDGKGNRANWYLDKVNMKELD